MGSYGVQIRNLYYKSTLRTPYKSMAYKLLAKVYGGIDSHFIGSLNFDDFLIPIPVVLQCLH